MLAGARYVRLGQPFELIQERSRRFPRLDVPDRAERAAGRLRGLRGHECDVKRGGGPALGSAGRVLCGQLGGQLGQRTRLCHTSGSGA